MAYSILNQQTMSQWVEDVLDDSCNTIELHKPNPDAGISMHAQGGDEMLKITRDGFYVRGERVPADDKEAEAVYIAFKQWLGWTQLQQQR